MSKIIAIIRADARHVFTNVIALVVCVGMIVVPSFYAWFNTAGSWDPYGNTSNLRIALVNSDEGYKSDLLPVEVNLGERTVSELRASKSIGYIVTDEDDARDGVASGSYYAAIIIPADFSRSMLTNLVSGDPDARPTVEYVSNQKRNAIANIVTQKASSAVSQTIDESFVDAAVEVGAGTLDELGSYLDDDQLASVASNLNDALGTATDQLRTTGTNLQAYAALVGSVRSLSDGAGDTLRSTLDASSGMGDMLREGSTGMRELGSALDGATDSLDEALSRATSSYDDVQEGIDGAFDTAGASTQTIADRLGNVKNSVDALDARLLDTLSDLSGDTAKLYELEGSYSGDDASVTYAHSVYLTVSGIHDRLSLAEQRTKTLSNGLQQTIDDLNNASTDAADAKAELDALVAQATAGISDIDSTYQTGLGSSLEGLASGIDEAADTADSLLSQVGDTSDQLTDTIASTGDDLGELETTLNDAGQKLIDAADDLDGTHDQLSSALGTNDLEQVRVILSADVDSLAGFISQPVQLNRNAVFPVANNGSAMAPFYTVLSIWIGAVILCALVKTSPSERMLARIGAKPHHAYFGRITFFVLNGLMQTLVIVGGDLFFLGIQCLHPWLFLLACLVASVVFVNLVFSLTASFGDVGKAIAVLLMVLQVAGSGGTFPMEMLPKAFQAIYPFLPFVHAENCLRAAIAGLYGLDFWVSLAKLSAFLVPSLVLGLLLRKPVIRLNHWFERQLESTKVM